jgi:hypothetical protein
MIRNATISSIGMSVLAATAFIAAPVSAQSSFGQLSYNGSSIPFSIGTGVGNDGYYMNRTQLSGNRELLLGLKASNAGLNSSSLPNFVNSPYADGGTYLMLDSSGRYVSPSGLNPIASSWNPTRPAWGFQSSVTINGQKADASSGLSFNITLTQPGDAVSGLAYAAQAISGGNYQVSQSPGLYFANPTYPQYDIFGANASYLIGDWKIRLDVYDTSTSTLVASQQIIVNVVPAPGALALLGVAGLAGGRRRRA